VARRGDDPRDLRPRRRHAEATPTDLADLGYLTWAVGPVQRGWHRTMPGRHDDRHDPRARPRIRRHLRRPRLPGWFSRLHRQDRRHRVLHGAAASRCSAPAMGTTPPPSTTASFPATSTKHWPVPARSWPATVAATPHSGARPAGSTRHSDKAGVTHDVKEYPAASHAFLNDTGNRPPGHYAPSWGRRHRPRTGLGQRRLGPNPTILATHLN